MSRDRRFHVPVSLAAAILVTPLITLTAAAVAKEPKADKATLQRGEYLVTVGGCTDCHTPGHFLGKPDMTRRLGGSDVGFGIPNAGVFLGPNLTPDDETGLGRWTPQQIVTAITVGRRPDGRQLMPVMPYPALARLKPEDAMAIALYLKSLPPIRNKVAGPFGPNDKPTSFVLTVMPGEAYSNLPKPPPPK